MCVNIRMQNRKPEHMKCSEDTAKPESLCPMVAHTGYSHRGKQLVPQKLKTAIANIVLVTFLHAVTKYSSKST